MEGFRACGLEVCQRWRVVCMMEGCVIVGVCGKRVCGSGGGVCVFCVCVCVCVCVCACACVCVCVTVFDLEFHV